MRRKAVRAIVVHTKDSIQHLKDDDDEMLRGNLATLQTQWVHSAQLHCTLMTNSAAADDAGALL